MLRLYSIRQAIATIHADAAQARLRAAMVFDAFGDCAIGDTVRAEVRDRV